jgi:putative transposase
MCEDIPVREKYSNPIISYDGVDWWLSFSYEKEFEQPVLTDATIGIDLGIKETAVCSDGSFYSNINKTDRGRKLLKRHKRQQRRMSRRTIGSKNKEKARKDAQKTQIKLNNLRNNHLHQVTTDIAKKLPKTVVMEDLNVSGLMKNKHLARSIAQQGWYKFRRYMTYKCERMGISLVVADRFYSSSKTCSNCGNKNPSLTLNDRVYLCKECGLKMDRDYNASLNLQKLAM